MLVMQNILAPYWLLAEKIAILCFIFKINLDTIVQSFTIVYLLVSGHNDTNRRES